MYSKYINTKTFTAMALLFSVSMPAISAEPPNTINLNQSFSPSFSPTDFASAVQVGGAPPQYAQEVVPSTRSLVAQQLSQYEDSQLTPEQRKRIKAVELERQRIDSNPYINTANPVVRSIMPDLAPGVTPPIIRVSKNILTSIVFTDLDGNPWFIEKVMLNRNQFNDSAGVDGEGKPTNILTIEPIQAIDYGNVTIMLKGKTLPVILLIASGQPDVDVRLDVRMKGKNPDIAANDIPISARAVSADIDEIGLGFLDGTIPSDAEMLASSDPAIRAWNYSGAIYIKSSLDVLYPSYHSRAKSPDNVNIYRFDNEPTSVTLMQRGGQPVTVTLSELPYQYDK